MALIENQEAVLVAIAQKELYVTKHTDIEQTANSQSKELYGIEVIPIEGAVEKVIS